MWPILEKKIFLNTLLFHDRTLPQQNQHLTLIAPQKRNRHIHNVSLTGHLKTDKQWQRDVIMENVKRKPYCFNLLLLKSGGILWIWLFKLPYLHLHSLYNSMVWLTDRQIYKYIYTHMYILKSNSLFLVVIYQSKLCQQPRQQVHYLQLKKKQKH